MCIRDSPTRHPSFPSVAWEQGAINDWGLDICGELLTIPECCVFFTVIISMPQFGYALLFFILVSITASPSPAQEPTELPPFEEWLEGVKTEAIAQGIRADIVEAALAGVSHDETVITADRNQPEKKAEFPTYINQRLDDKRLSRGRDKMAAHKTELAAVAKAYDVQARFIAAIWGLETNFGGHSGGRNVIQSLVTLAYDPRRTAYFRKELLVALKILDEGHVTVDKMTGSWAGAMGQPQFMPSSFMAFAQDFDGDGRRDIWNSYVDVFASIAFYLKSYGWRSDQTWGRQVMLPKDFEERVQKAKLGPPATRCALRNHLGNMTLAAWQDLGVRRLNGAALPKVDVMASLARPAGPDGDAYLTYGNYRAILRYNCSDYYAVTVGKLADMLKDFE